MTDEEFNTKDVKFENESFSLVDKSKNTKNFGFYFQLLLFFNKPHYHLLKVEIWQ
jgi:hypothetical protein